MPQRRPVSFVTLAPVFVAPPSEGVPVSTPESPPVDTASSIVNPEPESVPPVLPSTTLKRPAESPEVSSVRETQVSSSFDKDVENKGDRARVADPASGNLTVSTYVDPSPESGLNAPPEYPAVAVRRGWEGEVLLRVMVSTAGDAGEVLVEKGSGFAILDEAAVTAVRGWRFVPASEHGESVPGEVLLPVRFALKRGGS